MSYKATVVANTYDTYTHHISIEMTAPWSVIACVTEYNLTYTATTSDNIEQLLINALDDPFMPAHWPTTQASGSSLFYLNEPETQGAIRTWQKARDMAVLCTVALVGDIQYITDHSLNIRIARLHATYCYPFKPILKQVDSSIAITPLMPFLWKTVLISGNDSDWQNFFATSTCFDTNSELRRAAAFAKMTYETYNDAVQVCHIHITLYSIRLSIVSWIPYAILHRLNIVHLCVQLNSRVMYLSFTSVN